MLTIYQAKKMLELCSIPYEIQQKILIFFLSYGTSSSCVIKNEINEMNKCPPYKNLLYPERTLTTYFTNIYIFYYIKRYYEDDYEGDFPEFLYEISIAYDLYYINREYEVNQTKNELKAVVKKRLYKLTTENESENDK